jgi:dTDP-4-amino-4,6-dideoxygalactose transaminase
MRTTYLPFAVPDVDAAELAQIKEALESGWVTTGPKTRQFETEFAARVGARYAVAVNSCTAAMHLALDAIDLAEGDEVITTPYTFAATSEVIHYFKARPVFVDVDPLDLNMDVSLLEGAITPRTRAILPVHMAGLAANLGDIYAVARRHDLAVIEDAAHAFPASYDSRMIGNPLHEERAAVCFSFYATKTITTGEGGMICTNDEEMADKCRIMSLHGISRDAWKRYTAEGSWYYEIIAPGYKYNLTDIAAGMGIAQLAKAERMWQRRRDIACRYNAVFSKYPQLQIPFDPDAGGAETRAGLDLAGKYQGCRHAWHLYMLRLNSGLLAIDRAAFIEELKKRNIGASVHFIPLHLHPFYREKYGYRPDDYPVAAREYQREISLPLFSRMSGQDIEDVIDATVEIVEQFSI